MKNNLLAILPSFSPSISFLALLSTRSFGILGGLAVQDFVLLPDGSSEKVFTSFLGEEPVSNLHGHPSPALLCLTFLCCKKNGT